MTSSTFAAVAHVDRAVRLLDQRRLPHAVVYADCRDYRQVADAIRTLTVRGAPAIGLAAAFGAALAADELVRRGLRGAPFHAALAGALSDLESTRPTAVNLFWALQRMRNLAAGREAEDVPALMFAEAERMLDEDVAACTAMADHGASLIRDGANILTHCNTGALVTAAIGTALGAVRQAHEDGKTVHVWVDETRPLLQGARLTTWELKQLGIPFTLITDNMAAHLMRRGRVDLVIVGADRIAANGDTANKIGTYGLAVLARAHQIPFYVVAPTSTVDLGLDSGDHITIEERHSNEVTEFGGVRVAPEGISAANPAFDITPAHLISAIVTEAGVARPPYGGQPALAGKPVRNLVDQLVNDRRTSAPAGG